VDSSPAVANGIIYVGSRDKNLYAIDAVTGNEKWRFTTGDWVDSSPAVANGIVYVGSNDKNLYAIGANAVSPTTVPKTISYTPIPSQVTDAGSSSPQVNNRYNRPGPADEPTHPAPICSLWGNGRGSGNGNLEKALQSFMNR